MIRLLKKYAKNFIPDKVLCVYHYVHAITAALWYGNPSKSMTIVGITGTKGKTSSSEFAWSVLNSGGYKTGLIGTAHIMVGDTELENRLHMTMPSPWITQKLLKQMKNSGCTHVVLEVSSEGLKQYRHIGVHYDIAVFTNLSPEHLPSHNNSFEEYKKAKSLLFVYTQKTFKKEAFGFKKISIVNIDSEHGSYYLNIPLDQNLGYSLQEYMIKRDVDIEKNSIKLDGVWCTIKVPGIFNMNNALVGYMVGTTCGLPIEKIKKGIEAVTYIPGRMEEVVMGQSFRVFIDYAHEKLSMENLLTTGKAMKKNGGKIIVLFGAEGGGRDKRKRKEMAIVADTLADYVILSDVDPYDDNPDQIIADIAEHFTEKKTDENLFLIPDRTEGIKKAFSLAHENDIVFICGKGAEKSMERAGKVTPWDEQKIVRTLLQNHLSQ